MKTLGSWLKVIVYFEPSIDLTQVGLSIVAGFKAHFRIQQLYFSRYVDTLKNSMEISCQTMAAAKTIKRYFNSKKYVLAVTVENRGSGSLAHVYGYKAVSAMLEKDRDSSKDWNEFLDVVHWMCNMRGYDYMREIRFYGYAACCFADQVGKKNDEFLAKVQGKGQAGKAAASASKSAPQSKPARSSSAAARKASG